METHEAIVEMVAQIVVEAAPQRIVLFGSYARNVADADSDVDLLVLFERLTDRARMNDRIYRRLAGSTLPKDVVIATTAEFERYREVPNCIFWFVARLGRVIYEA